MNKPWAWLGGAAALFASLGGLVDWLEVPEAWAKHGLLGLVIFAVVVCLGFLLKAIIEMLRSAQAEAAKRLEKQQEEHRQERREARRDYLEAEDRREAERQRVNERVAASLDGLTAMIAQVNQRKDGDS